jgi:hypothetical protein
MELSSIQHIESDKLVDFQADLFITSLSPDSRCIAIARYLEAMPCRKIALQYSKRTKEQSFLENEAYFREKGFEIIPLVAEIPDVGGLLEGISSRKLSIILDCTCMSQRWYYEFFRWFGESQEAFDEVLIRFAYTMAAFVPDEGVLKVKKVREFLQIESRKEKSKKALILGLGHEAHVSGTIYKLEKPDLLYLFYADPPVDKRFVDQVFVNNHALINETPIRNLIAYPITNGQVIYQSLVDIILPIRDEFSVTLVPHGPKIFSVASMLIHMGYPDTRISYPVFKKKLVQERIPSGEPVVLDVLFEGEE